MSPPSPGIPLTLLLDELMPGLDRAAQVRRYNQLTNQLFTVEAAEAEVFNSQHQVAMARMSWNHGIMREEVAASFAKTSAEIAARLKPAPVLQAAAQAAPEVSLRSLLDELYPGQRDWRNWCTKYNRDMETAHNAEALSRDDAWISADEATKARERIPAIAKARKDAGRSAGGKAGLKKPEAKRRQRPGML